MKQHIRESNLIEDIDSEVADLQAYYAWRMLLKAQKLTHGTICRLQKRLTAHQSDLTDDQRGHYRKIDVWVGHHKGTPPLYIKAFMDNWLLDQADRDPVAAHIQFERIHPFVDGNGRTGRMLMWWMQLQRGQQPLLLLASERQKYYKWFSGEL